MGNVIVMNEVVYKIKDHDSIPIFVNHELRTLGHVLFLVCTGNTGNLEPRNLFVTSSPTELELYLQNVNDSHEVLIEVFGHNDYKGVIKYLKSIYK